MDFRQIQYFVALYEEQSITRAARRLHVVQPAVSMQIRRLEADYGLPLFERTSQGVYPNEAARRLYPLCTEILGRVQVVDQVLKEQSGRIAGKLAVGIPPSIAHSLMARLLLDFRKRHPDVQLSVYEGYTAHLAEWLIQGELDFAIMGEFEDERRLRFQPILAEDLGILTARGTEGVGPVLRGADLAAMNLVLPSAQNMTRIQIDAAFERAGIKLAPVLEVDSLATVLALVRHPGWASILPQSAMRDLADPSLRSVGLVEPTIRRSLVAAFPAQKPSSAAAQLFIEALTDALAEPVATS